MEILRDSLKDEPIAVDQESRPGKQTSAGRIRDKKSYIPWQESISMLRDSIHPPRPTELAEISTESAEISEPHDANPADTTVFIEDSPRASPRNSTSTHTGNQEHDTRAYAAESTCHDSVDGDSVAAHSSSHSPRSPQRAPFSSPIPPQTTGARSFVQQFQIPPTIQYSSAVASPPSATSLPPIRVPSATGTAYGHAQMQGQGQGQGQDQGQGHLYSSHTAMRLPQTTNRVSTPQVSDPAPHEVALNRLRATTDRIRAADEMAACGREHDRGLAFTTPRSPTDSPSSLPPHKRGQRQSPGQAGGLPPPPASPPPRQPSGPAVKDQSKWTPPAKGDDDEVRGASEQSVQSEQRRLGCWNRLLRFVSCGKRPRSPQEPTTDP